VVVKGIKRKKKIQKIKAEREYRIKMQTVQAYSVQRKLDVKEQSSKIDQEYETTEHFYRQNRNNLETR
jgi:hypothetical protein